MKTVFQIKILSLSLFICLTAHLAFSQSTADVLDEKTPVTWLGVDYSQAVYIDADSVISKDGRRITNYEIKKIYMLKQMETNDPTWGTKFTLKEE